MRFTNVVTIRRSAVDVFAFLAAFENVPRWNYAISETRKVSAGPVGVGSRYIQVRTVPRRSEESFEVSEHEPDRRLAIKGTFGPFSGEATYVLEPAGDATRLTNTFDLQPSGLASLVAPLVSSRVRAAVAENLAALKRLLEQRERA